MSIGDANAAAIVFFKLIKSRRCAVSEWLGSGSAPSWERITMGISKNCLAWAGVAAMIGSLRVFAADTAAPSNELETITVTAEKRSETEQSVPLSMTTFSAAALQQKEINTFFDYATKVPNLAFAPTGDGVGTAPHGLDPRHLRRQRDGLLPSMTRRCRIRSIRESWISTTLKCCGARRAPCMARARWAAWCAS